MFSVTVPKNDTQARSPAPHHERIQGRFLKGPIPLQPIALAAKLPGQALAIYLAIHHRAALTRNDSVTLPTGLLKQFGISRDSKARSPHALANASLVPVERRKGRTARITLQPQRTGTGG